MTFTGTSLCEDGGQVGAELGFVVVAIAGGKYRHPALRAAAGGHRVARASLCWRLKVLLWNFGKGAFS